MTEASERDAYALLTSLVRRQAYDFEAVNELAALGEAAIAAIEEQLQLEDAAARRFAIRVLAKIGSRKGISSLLNVVLKERESDPEIVAIALRGATEALGPDDSGKVSKLFASFGDHEDAFVRAAAVDGLAKVQADVPKLLLHLASDEDEFVADRAKLALRGKVALGAESGSSDGTGLQVGDLPLLTSLASRTKSERLGAIREIIASGQGPETVTRLLADEDNRMIRLALMETAHHLKSQGCYSTLRAIIEDPAAGEGERALAFQALVAPAEVADSELVALVERFGKTRDPFERAASAAFGMRSKRVPVIEAAAIKLRDNEGHVRETVARAFRDTPEAAAVPHVISRLRDIGAAKFPNSKAIEEWASLVEGLVRLSKAGGYVSPDAAQVMLDAMRASPEAVRALAADAFDRFAALESLPPRSIAEAASAFVEAGRYARGLALLAGESADVDYAVPALVKALHRTGADDTYAISEILVRSDLPAARGAIARLSNHFDSRVRELCRTAASAPSYENQQSTPANSYPPAGASRSTPVAAPPQQSAPSSPLASPNLNAFPQPTPSSLSPATTSAASAALADQWGVDRPTIRQGGEAMSTAERKLPPMHKIPEDAPLLLQEPPSTYRDEVGAGVSTLTSPESEVDSGLSESTTAQVENSAQEALGTPPPTRTEPIPADTDGETLNESPDEESVTDDA